MENSLILFCTNLSDGTAAIRMLIHELQLNVEVVRIDKIHEESLRLYYPQFDASQGLPQLHDGPAIIASTIHILLHLMRFDHPGAMVLHPPNVKHQLEIMRCLRLNCVVVQSLVDQITKEVCVQKSGHMPHYNLLMRDICRTLDEGSLMTNMYVAGTSMPTIADFALVGSLSSLISVFGYPRSSRYPRFCFWLRMMMRRPSYKRHALQVARSYRRHLKISVQSG